MDKLETYVESQRERFAVPGASVAVTRGEEVLVERGFGTRDLTNDATPDTLFAIGSATKAFTATICGALVDDGLAEWDTPIREYLPRFRMKDPVASEQMTIRDLLCHRSGLPRHDVLWYADTTSTREEIVGVLRHLEPSRSFRETFQYNNLMFLTAGYLAGELMGTSWEDAVRTRLLDPLGMHNTNFSVADSQHTLDFALPYLEKDDVAVEIPFRNIDLAGPAASINSSVADMKRWAMLNANNGTIEGTSVISAAARAQLHTPAMVMPPGLLWEEVYGTGYALGWFLASYRGHKLVYHEGSIDGFSALVATVPERQIGIVVLTNMSATLFPLVVAYSVLDELLGLEPLPWGDRIFDLTTAMRAARKEAKQHRADNAKQAPPTFPLAEYAATYGDDGYGDMTIAVVDGALTANYKDLALTMEHRHYDTWDLCVEALEVTIPAKFEADFEGNLTTFVVPLEPTVKPIRFSRRASADLSSPDRLAKLVGRFVFGPITLTVELVDDALVATQDPGGLTLHLVPARDWTFSAKEAPQLSVEFVLDDAGESAEKIFAADVVLTRDAGIGG